MVSSDLAQWFLWFVFYSFVGWFFEVLYNALVNREFVDPGFLNLPLVPIYGFGGVLAVFAFTPWIANPFLVFVLGVLSATVLEYVTSYALEKLFRKQLWTYASMPLNIDGRVCLHMSALFGALVLLVVYVLQPELAHTTAAIPPLAKTWLSWTIFGLIMLDLVLSLATAVSLRRDTSYKTTRAILPRLSQFDEKWDVMRADQRKGQAHLLNRFINRLNRYLLSRLGMSFPVLKQK